MSEHVKLYRMESFDLGDCGVLLKMYADNGLYVCGSFNWQQMHDIPKWHRYARYQCSRIGLMWPEAILEEYTIKLAGWLSQGGGYVMDVGYFEMFNQTLGRQLRVTSGGTVSVVSITSACRDCFVHRELSDCLYSLGEIEV